MSCSDSPLNFTRLPARTRSPASGDDWLLSKNWFCPSSPLPRHSTALTFSSKFYLRIHYNLNGYFICSKTKKSLTITRSETKPYTKPSSSKSPSVGLVTPPPWISLDPQESHARVADWRFQTSMKNTPNVNYLFSYFYHVTLRPIHTLWVLSQMYTYSIGLWYMVVVTNKCVIVSKVIKPNVMKYLCYKYHLL